MKTLIACYSYTGRTRALCKTLKGENCDIYEISEQKMRSTVGAYVRGGFQALTLRSSAIRPVDTDTGAYDLVVLCCPVWASGLAPAGIAFLQQAKLSGKRLVIVAVSASGEINEARVKKAAAFSGAELLHIYSHKSGDAAPVITEMLQQD